MATIVTRQTQLYPLTHAQVDANFTNLNVAVIAAQTTADLALSEIAAGGPFANITYTGLLTGNLATFSGQVTSTVATGTAPLVIASTTLVPNLNAALLGGATFAAPGSIGSGTPGSVAATSVNANAGITATSVTVDTNITAATGSNVMRVKGATADTNGLEFSVDPATKIATINNFANTDLRIGTNNATRVTVTAAGNIAVGVATANYGGWSRAVSIGNGTGSAAFEVVTGNDTDTGNIGGLDFINSAYTSKEVAQITGLMSGSTATNRGAIIRFATKKDGGALTEAMRIENAQNVVINGNSASGRLTIGTAATGATLNDIVYLGGYSTTAQIRYAFNHAGSGTWGIGSDGVSAMIFGKSTAGGNGAVTNEYARFSAAGNLLVSQTVDDGVNKLQVTGGVKVTGTLNYTGELRRSGAPGAAGYILNQLNASSNGNGIYWDGTSIVSGVINANIVTNTSSAGFGVIGNVSTTIGFDNPQFTVATLPSASVIGRTVFCTNAAVAPCLAIANGTNWKRCDNAATTVI